MPSVSPRRGVVPDWRPQMTQYGDRLFNPEFRPVQFMEKTFFNVRQDLPHSEGVKGDYAYYNFAVRIPDADQFVPAGSTEVVEGKPLPPSLVVHPGNAKKALEPVAYSECFEGPLVDVPD